MSIVFAKSKKNSAATPNMDLQFWSATKVLWFVITIIFASMADDAAVASYPGNKTDQLALLNIKLQISDDPQGVLKSWNDSHHHCDWPGVTCGVRHQRVTNLTLQGKSLLGSISPYIGNLSFLKSIELGGNRFNGDIPQEIGFLFRLKNLILTRNTLGGGIPVNLSQCLELRFLDISDNKLVGKLPAELGSLKKLEFLDISKNFFTKEIPSSFGNLSLLKELLVGFNNFEGRLPNEIGFLRVLQRLQLHVNKFSGPFPSSVYNISTLSSVSILENLIEGKLPSDIGLKMPNLEWFSIAVNQFKGNIPSSIINATNLEVLDFAVNQFEGQVPTNLGNLPKLRILNLPANFLGNNGTGDLDFITSLTNCTKLQRLNIYRNYFGGQLPRSIGNLSLRVESITMGQNKILGTIPVSLTRLSNLYSLKIQENYLIGDIPREFGKLTSLQMLNLSGNMLTGEIPSALCNLTSIYQLLLMDNNLEGTLPPCLGNSQSLKEIVVSKNNLFGNISAKIFDKSFSLTSLNLSNNLFTGPVPPEVGKLANIIAFDISNNNFSGQIPTTLGDCKNLQQLSMRGNNIQGTIPKKLASLKAIEYLDLSQNNLTGQIPKDMEMLPSLRYLNLSFNNLEGEVPRNGVFSNSSQIILGGNFKLCGGISELRLPSCPIHRKKNWKLLIIIIAFSICTLIPISVALLHFYQRRYRGKDSSPKTSKEDKLLRVSYHQLQRATGGFSQENIVGSGSFGVVYKGQLDEQNGKLVAVKVLDLQKNGVSKSFKAECNALRNIRHRNLVPVLSYCSSIDFKGDEFKALVYKFMENGSLDMWLHPEISNGTSSRSLNLLQRLNIAIDVAHALQYLHHNCGFVIAHCDLKPSNVLLDNDLTAHVGDFGLVRLLSNDSSKSGTSSSVAIKGSIGYAAPEYAMGYAASTHGDVFSYGILLLEMFTGKRPTDEYFINDLNLHGYVKKNLLERVEEIIDPLLCSRQGEENTNDVIVLLENSNEGNANLSRMMNCIISIFEIGLKCSETSPNVRIDMNEVTRQMLAIRDGFLLGER